MELNAIKSKGNWGEMAADLNANFAAVTAELEKLKATNVKFKGYFTSEKTLMASFPSPSPGDTAWVGEVYPGTVYECKATGAWSNTGKIPSTPSVQLADYARKELVNSRTTEYNVSVQHPTSGTGGTNSYTLEAAIVQVPPELRNVGLKVSFINSDGKVETWEFYGGTFTSAGSWKQIPNQAMIERIDNDIFNLNADKMDIDGTYDKEITLELSPSAVWQSLKNIFPEGKDCTIHIDNPNKQTIFLAFSSVSPYQGQQYHTGILPFTGVFRKNGKGGL